jgi:hypothetical protein
MDKQILFQMSCGTRMHVLHCISIRSSQPLVTNIQYIAQVPSSHLKIRIQTGTHCGRLFEGQTYIPNSLAVCGAKEHPNRKLQCEFKNLDSLNK